MLTPLNPNPNPNPNPKSNPYKGPRLSNPKSTNPYYIPPRLVLVGGEALEG